VRRLGLVLAVAMSITTVGAAAGGRPQNADLSLRGTVSVRDFVVPRGDDENDLGRSARSRLARHRRRRHAARASTPDITLKAGRVLRIGRTGRIRPKSTRSPASVRDNPVVVDQQSNFQILGSDRVELEGNLVAPQGTSVKVASAEFGSVVLDGSITTLDGSPGSSAENDGQNAGSSRSAASSVRTRR
jgi:hypothetical protein